MGKQTKFQGSIGEAITRYQENSKQPDFWQHTAFLSALENSQNAIKSINVLKKHLPKKFHPLVRFSQPRNVWILSVKKGITATQINLLLDDLSVIIAKDIGYAPRIQVKIVASNWHYAGFPLYFSTKTKQVTPSDKEAEQIIDDFLHNKLI